MYFNQFSVLISSGMSRILFGGQEKGEKDSGMGERSFRADYIVQFVHVWNSCNANSSVMYGHPMMKILHLKHFQ